MTLLLMLPLFSGSVDQIGVDGLKDSLKLGERDTIYENASEKPARVTVYYGGGCLAAKPVLMYMEDKQQVWSKEGNNHVKAVTLEVAPAGTIDLQCERAEKNGYCGCSYQVVVN